MKKSISMLLLVMLMNLFLFLDCANCQSSGDSRKGFKYINLFEKKLEGEGSLGVRAFDLRRNNGKDGIAVCGEKLYIFSKNGALLFQSLSDEFQAGTKQIRVGKFSKNGYYNNIIATDGERVLKIFDSFGINLSTIPLSSYEYAFFSKDINKDGIDELILNGKAFFTKDEGMSWNELWVNRDIRRMQDIRGSENEGGFCYNQYIGPIFSVDKNGKILFQSEPGKNIRCLTAGDFDGGGIKDDIATPDVDGTVYIYDEKGFMLNKISMNIDGEIISLNEATSIEVGRLNLNRKTDDIVVAGRRGIVACNVVEGIIWSFIKWGGWNSTPRIDTLFVNDLDKDGNVEIVIAKGNEIMIFSNAGELLQKLILDGKIGRWKYPNAMMDIADLDSDGYQEIIAVTDQGNLYVFQIEK